MSRRTQRSPYSNTTNDDFGSDDETFGSAEDQPLVLSDSSPSVASAASTTSRWIPIQAKGGIDSSSFSLSTLAESKPHFYGVARTKERRRFENLLQRWKTSQRDEYNELVLGSPDPNNATPVLPTVVELRTPPVPQTPSVPQSPPLIPHLPSQPSPRPFVPYPSTMSGSMNDTLRGYYTKAETITVNSLLVEKNKPFRIVKRGEYKNKEGLVVNVYIITLADLDPRWLTKNPPPFELFHIVGTNECLAKIPGFDYPYLFDQQAEEAGRKAANMTDEGDFDAINIARNQVLANQERHNACYRLIFPVILNNDIFSPNAIDGKVKPKVHSMHAKWSSTFSKSDGTQFTKDFQSTRLQIEWKIAVHEEQQRTATTYKPSANELVDRNDLQAKCKRTRGGCCIGFWENLSWDFCTRRCSSSAFEGRCSTSSSSSPAAPPAAPPAALVLHSHKHAVLPGVRPIESSAAGRQANKPTTEELSRESHRSTVESRRKEKRRQMRDAKRTFPSQVASALQDAANFVKYGDNIVVDAQNNPVTYSRLHEMVAQYGEAHGMTPENAHRYLDKTYNVQDFAKSFTELLNDKSSAWTDAEKEISFVQDDSQEQIDGWEDEEMFEHLE